MLDVISIGGATQDIYLDTDVSTVVSLRDKSSDRSLLGFDYGSKIEVSNLLFTFGGGGANTAVTFARLGLAAGLCAALGDDETGHVMKRGLVGEGIDTSLVCVYPDQHTGRSLILRSFEGERTLFTYRGANTLLGSQGMDWEKLAPARWFYIPSLSGPAADLLPEVVDFAHRKGIRLALNPGSSQIQRWRQALSDPRPERLAYLLSGVDVLLLNREEAQILTRTERTVHPDPVRLMLEKLRRLGPRIVVITEGGKGARAFDGEEMHKAEAFPAKVVDTLGAGDAFGSALVGALVLDLPLEQALKWGAANSASVVQQYGAQPGILTRAQIEELIGREGCPPPPRGHA